MALSKTTRDHDEIRQWAEARGAVPAEVSKTHTGDEPGILRFCFPDAPNRKDANLREISWDEFFEKFDENDLELVYQEETAEGNVSNFNKLIHSEAVEGRESHEDGSAEETGSRNVKSRAGRSRAGESGNTGSSAKKKTSGARNKASKSAGKSAKKSSPAKGSASRKSASKSEGSRSSRAKSPGSSTRSKSTKSRAA